MVSPFLLAQALYPHVFSMHQGEEYSTMGYPVQALLDQYPKQVVAEALWVLEQDLKQRGFELIVYTIKEKEYLTTRKIWGFSDKIHFDEAVILGVISLEALDARQVKAKGYKPECYREFRRKDIEEFCYLHDLPIKTHVGSSIEFLARQGYLVQTKRNPLSYMLTSRFFLEFNEQAREELHVLLISALKSIHTSESITRSRSIEEEIQNPSGKSETQQT